MRLRDTGGRRTVVRSFRVALSLLRKRRPLCALVVCGAVVLGLVEPLAAAPAKAKWTNKMADAARSQLGVREVGENGGDKVRVYQKSVKNDHYALNAPWCSSFVTWAGLQANDPTPFRSAIVSEWIVAADHGRHGMSFVRQSSVRAGDIVAFRKGGKWQHMGVVSSVDKEIFVISGNTTAVKGADGVFEKPLSNWTKKGYDVNFIRNSG